MPTTCRPNDKKINLENALKEATKFHDALELHFIMDESYRLRNDNEGQSVADKLDRSSPHR